MVLDVSKKKVVVKKFVVVEKCGFKLVVVVVQMKLKDVINGIFVDILVEELVVVNIIDWICMGVLVFYVQLRDIYVSFYKFQVKGIF